MAAKVVFKGLPEMLTNGITTSYNFGQNGPSRVQVSYGVVSYSSPAVSLTEMNVTKGPRYNKNAGIPRDIWLKQPHPFFMQKRVVTAPYGVASATTTTAHGVWVNSTSGVLGTISDSVYRKTWEDQWEATSDKALDKLFSELRDGPNLAVDFIEGGQTLKMLKDVSSFRKIVKKVVEVFLNPSKTRYRYHARTSRGVSEQVASRWLEYRYGWLPLMFSVYDTAEAIRKALERQYNERTLKVRASTTISGVTRNIYLPGLGQLVDQKWKAQYRVEFGATFTGLSNPFNQLAQFTSLNPVGIAYETLTLSFVIDWFVDIGGWMERWENYVLYQSMFRGGYQTQSWRFDTSFTKSTSTSAATGFPAHEPIPGFDASGNPIQYDPGQGAYVPNQDGGTSYQVSGQMLELGLRRTVLTALPKPAGLRFTPKLGAKRIVDAVALLTGMRPRGARL